MTNVSCVVMYLYRYTCVFNLLLGRNKDEKEKPETKSCCRKLPR